MVRAKVIPAAQLEYVRDTALESVKERSTLQTDSFPVYDWAGGVHYHHNANHAGT